MLKYWSYAIHKNIFIFLSKQEHHNSNAMSVTHDLSSFTNMGDTPILVSYKRKMEIGKSELMMKNQQPPPPRFLMNQQKKKKRRNPQTLKKNNRLCSKPRKETEDKHSLYC
jgi:ABC-type oligopeptide transport system ATPase subunit